MQPLPKLKHSRNFMLTAEFISAFPYLCSCTQGNMSVNAAYFSLY